MILQIVITIFVFATLKETINEYRRHTIILYYTVFWSMVWFAILIIVWIPNLTGDLAKILGIARGIDSVVYISVVILFYLVFRLLVRFEKMEKQITQLVRRESLKELHKTKHQEDDK
jgi:small membrane protein